MHYFEITATFLNFIFEKNYALFGVNFFYLKSGCVIFWTFRMSDNKFKLNFEFQNDPEIEILKIEISPITRFHSIWISPKTKFYSIYYPTQLPIKIHCTVWRGYQNGVKFVCWDIQVDWYFNSFNNKLDEKKNWSIILVIHWMGIKYIYRKPFFRGGVRIGN